jgi:phospholipase A1
MPLRAHIMRTLSVCARKACASSATLARMDAIRAKRSRAAALLLAAVLHFPGANAGDTTDCTGIADERARLRCYDEAAGRQAAPGQEPLRELGHQSGRREASSAMSVRWELEADTKQGVWNVRPYQPLFLLLARYSDNPNDSPQSPTHPTSESVPLQETEAEFQISFKTKAWQNVFSTRADLWLAYTQQSQWQLYSPSISRPFRETDYQPEVFVTLPTDYALLGLRGRFLGAGLVHQSNGRANPLSRSWNRAYLQFGFERGNFSLVLRPWYRFPESLEADDNPDIVDYLGHGDVLAVYLWGAHQLSLLTRYNVSTHHGALQAGWSFPIDEKLKGYVKLFAGYGETLIDYNWKQTTIGFGVLLADWL